MILRVRLPQFDGLRKSHAVLLGAGNDRVSGRAEDRDVTQRVDKYGVIAQGLAPFIALGQHQKDHGYLNG